MTQSNDRKSGPSKGLSGKDIELWRAVTQNDDVLPGRGYHVVAESPGATGKKRIFSIPAITLASLSIRFLDILNNNSFLII